jgi:2-dehydro-3-deoxy-L-rhamnonate dehydrogenase (NAD+)
MTQRFENRVALITGGASGIGLATAERLVREGARAILWDVNPAALDAASQHFGDAALCQRVDVTQESSVQESMQEAMAALGRLDILVNSAGIVGATAPFWEQGLTNWQRVIELNLSAVFLVSSVAVPHLIRSDRGRIVNLASIAGKEGNRNQAAYSASKAGVIGLTKSMGKDLVEHGVMVNAITPSMIQSELVDQMPAAQRELVLAKVPMGRAGRVEEVAAMVCWLASEECSFSTGAVFDLSGGRATY